VRIFKTKWFTRFARQEGINTPELCEAIARAERGLIDADLGGNVIKQRIARPHEGRSGGFRSIVLFRAGERAVFVYGFAKNKRDNITQAELRDFRDLAQTLLAYTDAQIQTALDTETLSEVECHDQDL